ncbi:uncharacterized protein EDB91DRAFT_1040233, partial [Suillus paluster]|uniref:uncharacterized protein n=1 Tax=Suillus paluster TaxID=48578 RepID=UPI001B87F712
RVSRDTFDRLVAKLVDNPIFTSTGTKPQQHVKYQLGCFLFHYGMRGSDTLRVAKELAIGHGFVFKYCCWVSRAFRELKVKFLVFLNAPQKEIISDYIKETSGFPACIGSADGSLIRFSDIP